MGERVYVRQFRADLVAPSAARSAALDQLATLLGDNPPSDRLRDDLALVVSELVTNAVLAGSPEVHLRLAASGPSIVTVSISDGAGGWPQPRDADIDDTGGRGLALVSAVARTWGVRMDQDRKTVWAELAG